MSSVPVSQKPRLTQSQRSPTDEVYIVDKSEPNNADKSKKIQHNDLIAPISSPTRPDAWIPEVGNAMIWTDSNDNTTYYSKKESASSTVDIELS